MSPVPHDAQEVEEDVAPLRRDEIIKQAMLTMGKHDIYRISEFEDVAKKLKSFFGLSFEVDHAKALLSSDDRGEHHPDNLQLILKAHNSQKNNNNWNRFTFDEQVEYIAAAIKLQQLVASRFGDELDDNVLTSLISRLKNVY